MGTWWGPKPAPAQVPAEDVERRVETARRESEAAGKREATAATEERVALLILRVFDLAESYPDTEEKAVGTRPISYMFPAFTETYTYTVKIPGWRRLLDDLQTVAEAQDVSEASSRLGVKK
jgi:hypothetical protein